IFLVHPVQVEAVTYISGLPDVLSGFFILAGLLFFKSGKNILTLLTLLLAFLSKEIAITFFAFAWLITIYEWKSYDKKTLNTKLKWLTVFTIISIIYFILKLTVLNFTGTADLTDIVNDYTESILIRTITFISIIWEYAKLIIYPVHLFFEKSVVHATTLLAPKGIFGLTVLIGGCGAAYNSFLKDKKFLFGFTWFFIPLIPVSGIFIISNAFYAERWLYLPLIGVVFGIAALWENLKTKEAKAIYICILVIVSMTFATRTIFRNREWADPQEFFENEIANNPYSPRIYNQLGTVHFAKRNYNRALSAIQKSIELDDAKSSPIFRFNLGNTYYYLGKNDKAIFWLNEALEMKPDYEKAKIVLNKILEENKIYQ
ncbi:MAG: tetratricopeptide repeat protein, partial [Candidatus Gracilibacteria bacterium]|nr:tetratricopeptide repeat protein [Candidatus Gracilibacteria bacterium]